MSLDLAPLLEAYRAETPGEGLDRQAIERRIIASLSERRAPGKKRIWLLPMGMGLLGSVALAATAGPTLWQRLGHEAAQSGSTSQAAAAGVTRQTAEQPTIEGPNAADASAQPPAPVLEAAPLGDRRVEARAIWSASSSVVRRPPTDVATKPQKLGLERRPDGAEVHRELADYEAARRLQVTRRYPRAALHAWNEYLQRFPAGVLSSEARFHRVRCLIELGEHERARVALRPFAAGMLGPERQTQAFTLLRALDELAQ